MTVVALGEAMIRLSPPRGDQLLDARSLDVRIGGAEANVAVALAALGVPARWIGALPRNPLGERIANELAAAAVDVSRVVWRDDSRVGTYYVELPVPPRPARVVYDRRRSAITTMVPDELEPEMLAGASHAVVSGITAALQPSGFRLATAFLALAREAGAAQVLDINYRSQLWPTGEAREALTALAREVDVLVCSAHDARSVFELDAVDEDLPLELRGIAPNAKLVVVTAGPRGALAWDEEAGVVDAVPPEVEVVDPLGAGDALVAGLIWGALDGLDLPRRLQAGVTLAALACTVRGDHARFDRPMLQAALSGAPVKSLR